MKTKKEFTFEGKRYKIDKNKAIEMKKQEKVQRAKTLLEIGEEKLSQCKTIKGKKAIRKTNRHLRKIIEEKK